jgi:hypothetical protein
MARILRVEGQCFPLSCKGLGHGKHRVAHFASRDAKLQQIDVPVSIAEKMLDTVSNLLSVPWRSGTTYVYFVQTYSVWQHESGDAIVRTTSYSLPEHLHSHVDVIQPTTMFGLFKPMRTTSHFDEVPAGKAATGLVELASGAVVDASCNTTITPRCLRQLYQVFILAS